jgi:hypothetical protein
VGSAEIIHYDVECGEEGVHIDHENRFLLFGDWLASRL